MKKLLYVCLALVLIVGIGIAGLVFFIDPNQFKGQITQQVQKATGQELIINGDIGWQLFPSLGFSLGPIALKNPPGFGEENLVQFSSANLSISVTPLLSNTLDIGNIELNQARIFLQTLKNGQTNLDGLNKQDDKAAIQEPKNTSNEDTGNSWTITLAGISVKDASIVILDDQAGTITKVDKFNFELDRFAPGEWSALSFDVVAQKDSLNLSAQGKTQLFISKEMTSAEIKGLSISSQVASPSLPKGTINTTLNAAGLYTVATQLAELKSFDFTINDTTISGTGSLQTANVPVIRINLNSENIDLDELLALQSGSTKGDTEIKQKTKSKAAPLSEVEPDLSVLKAIDFKGSLNIAKLKANNIHVTDITSTMVIKDGIAEMTNFGALLYQGKIEASARINAKKTPARYSVKKNISGVQALPMLKDLTGKKLLSGTMDLMIDVTGTGLSPKRLRSGITGSIAADVLDGAIWGVNIPKMVRKAGAVIKGKESIASVTTFSEDEKTDFSSMKMTMNLGKGIASTKDLLVTAPFVQISGAGQSNLLKEDLDFLIKTKISKDIKEQEDVELYVLRDSTIPINIKGTWQEPKIQLAVEDLLKERAQKEVQKGLDKIFNKEGSADGEKSDTKSAEKLLKGLFN